MRQQDRDDAGERQVVVFDLAGETYGMDIAVVREIIRMPAVTRVPNAPAYVEGVVNLRGKVIPVLDLRKRLGLEAAAPTKETRVVVVDSGGDDIAVIVDAVTEVLRVPSDAVEAATAPRGAARGHVEGIANLDDRLVILLNVASAISADEAQAAAA